MSVFVRCSDASNWIALRLRIVSANKKCADGRCARHQHSYLAAYASTDGSCPLVVSSKRTHAICRMRQFARRPVCAPLCMQTQLEARATRQSMAEMATPIPATAEQTEAHSNQYRLVSTVIAASAIAI